MTTNTTPAQAGQQDYPESPMRKVAQALREKAAAEREAFDQRIQSGEWGPMPEPETEADSWVLPGSISDVWTTFRGERCLTPAGDDYYTAAQVRAAYEAGRASVAGSTAATGAGAVPDVDVERIAVNQYRPVPAGVITYKVVAGDGTRSLFSGTKDECEIVARKLTEAFLDGAHVALAASQGAPAAPQPPAAQVAEEAEPVAWATHHDEPLLFPTEAEARAYCEDDEQPIPLYPHPAQAEDKRDAERFRELLASPSTLIARKDAIRLDNAVEPEALAHADDAVRDAIDAAMARKECE